MQRDQRGQQDWDRPRPPQPPHPRQVNAVRLRPSPKRLLLEVSLAKVQPDLPSLSRSAGIIQFFNQFDSQELVNCLKLLETFKSYKLTIQFWSNCYIDVKYSTLGNWDNPTLNTYQTKCSLVCNESKLFVSILSHSCM